MSEESFVIIVSGAGTLVGTFEPNCNDDLVLCDPAGLTIQIDQRKGQVQINVHGLGIPCSRLQVCDAWLVISSHDVEPQFRKAVWEQYHALMVRVKTGIMLTSNMPGKT